MSIQRTPRPLRKGQTSLPESPSINSGIPLVVSTTVCHIHAAGYGEPCHDAPGLTPTGRRVSGICNSRAIHAGMNGVITSMSLMGRTFDRTRS